MITATVLLLCISGVSVLYIFQERKVMPGRYLKTRRAFMYLLVDKTNDVSGRRICAFWSYFTSSLTLIRNIGCRVTHT